MTRREWLSVTLAAPVLRSWPGGPPQTGLTPSERGAAVAALERTRDAMLGQLSELSHTQWRYAPASDVWSAAQILEHVTVVEESVFTQVRNAAGTRTPLPPDRRPRTRDQVIDLVATNRTTRRLTSPEVFRPTGRWPTTLALVAAFTLQRRAVLDFVTATADDLRAFAWENPIIGLTDAYQWLLFIAGHCDRHSDQLAELRSLPTFPAR